MSKKVIKFKKVWILLYIFSYCHTSFATWLTKYLLIWKSTFCNSVIFSCPIFTQNTYFIAILAIDIPVLLICAGEGYLAHINDFSLIDGGCHDTFPSRPVRGRNELECVMYSNLAPIHDQRIMYVRDATGWMLNVKSLHEQR